MGVNIRNDVISVASNGSILGTEIYYSGGNYMPEFNELSGTWTGQHVCVWRTEPLMPLSKVIVLGTLGVCAGDDTSTAPLDDEAWSSQSKFKPQRMGDFREMVGPTFSQCEKELPMSDVIIEFFDVHPSLTSGLLDWVTLDKATNTIRV